MRTSLLSIVITIAVLAASCGEGGVTYITSKSPNGNTTVTVNASRANSLDPWKINLQVKAYDFKEGSLKFEIYAGDLKQDENVKFDWQDENNCVITFTQSDDVKRSFRLIATSDNVQLAEM